MRKLTAITLVLGAVSIDPSTESKGSDEQSRGRIRVLWLGSSSTSKALIRCTDEMVRRGGGLAIDSTKGAGYVRVDFIARTGDYGPVGFDAIRKGKYDFVVLQVSSGVLWDPMITEKAPAVVDQICEVVRKGGAVPILYEHFVSGKSAGKQDLLTELCVKAALRNRARLAPCGSAWKNVQAHKGKEPAYQQNLFARDQRHAGRYGNYLMACCIYSALTGRSPVGDAMPSEQCGVTLEDAAYMQTAAWRQYQKRAKELEMRGVRRALEPKPG
jgi:hypothetical protein